MTPKELVLGGYASFAEGDMESLAKIYHAVSYTHLTLPTKA